MELIEIKNKIEVGLPGSSAQILDPRKDGVHLKAIVVFAGFENMSLIEQHRAVYDCLKDELASGELHALALETKIKQAN